MQINDLLNSALEIRNVAATVVSQALKDELNMIASRFERLAFSADERLEGELPSLELQERHGD
jgi:hypothetical protein